MWIFSLLLVMSVGAYAADRPFHHGHLRRQ